MNRILSLGARGPRVSTALVFLLVLSARGGSARGGESASSRQAPVLLDSKTSSNLLVHLVNPEYPAIAQVNYIQGHVRVNILVSAEGRLISAHVTEGEPLLAAAALRAIRQWRYRPYVTPDGPKAFRTDADVNFALSFRGLAHLPSHPDRFFERQVQPPQVAAAHRDNLAATGVPFRVLVGPEGQVLDAKPLTPRESPQVATAQGNVGHWRFRPARWGALAIPWYLIVKVRVAHPWIRYDARNSDAH